MTRTADRDLIVVVSSSQGWKYPLARMVTDTDGNVAVFTKRGASPAHTFQLPSPKQVSAIRGTFTTTDGQTIEYRRRGASCGYQLAKCNVKTPALLKHWPEEPMRAEVSPSPAAPEDDLIGVPVPDLDLSPTAIRKWARHQGRQVSDRGRIPQDIIKAYKAAHAG